MRPTDLADYLCNLPIGRQVTIAQQLPDARLTDVLEGLSDDDQTAIVSGLEANRATDILDVMQPNDTAGLVFEPPETQAQAFLPLMEPEETEDVCRPLPYTKSTAGSLMTTDPVTLDPDATAAQMLVSVRREDLPTFLAVVAFVTRLPGETSISPYLGMVRIQRVLRESPQTLLGTTLGSDIEAVSPQVHTATVMRLLTIYNLAVLSVVDRDSHPLDAVSVDDLFDELLPEDWKDYDDEVTDCIMARSIDG